MRFLAMGAVCFVLGFAATRLAEDEPRVLNLTNTRVTDAGLAELPDMPLENVGIGSTAVGDVGLGHLRRFELKELDLYRNTNITDAGMRHLEHQPGLEKPMLRGVKVTATGLAHLANLKSLREINASLSMNDEGMVHLRNLTSLRRLGLYSNRDITDAGVAHLTNLKSLEFLQLQFTKVSDVGLASLEDLPLRFLDLRGTGVSIEGRDKFKAKHPKCRILR